MAIELSRLIYDFLKSDSSANVFAKVKGKRKREIGFVVPALYMVIADTSENGKRVVKILADEFKKINERYPHFDVIITDGFMSRPVVNEIVKDIVINIKYSSSFFLGGGGGGLILEGGGVN